jgi:hypothetical protein
MTEADFMLLATAWGRMDSAAVDVTFALPSVLTQRVAALDHERLAMRAVVQSILRDAAKAEARP